MAAIEETKYKVALIICSTRSPRVGPTIATWLTSIINPLITTSTTTIKFETVDLLDFSNLPISPSGPLVPAQQPLPLPDAPYDNAAVNAWSKHIRGYDAFVFLTPQYNWSFPAAVKVALDHLFQEWVGKPAMVVAYGGRGGGKAYDALKGVLVGLDMRIVDAEGGVGRVELPLSRGLANATQGVLNDEVVAAWVEAGKAKDIEAGWKGLVELLQTPVEEKKERKH